MGQTSTLLPQLFYITTCAVDCDVTEKDLPYPVHTFSEKTQCLLPSSFHSGWCKQLLFLFWLLLLYIHTHTHIDRQRQIDIHIIPLGKKFEFCQAKLRCYQRKNLNNWFVQVLKQNKKKSSNICVWSLYIYGIIILIFKSYRITSLQVLLVNNIPLLTKFNCVINKIPLLF